MICAECSFDWELPSDDVLRALASASDAYRGRVERFLVAPDAAAIRRRPSPEVWSALEYAAHIRDVIGFYGDRIRRVVDEERPQMAGADFSAMAEHRRYRDEDPAAVLDQIAASSVVVEAHLRSLTADQWTRVGIGMDGDERTVLVLARRLAHDCHHHLLDLDRLAAALL